VSTQHEMLHQEGFFVFLCQLLGNMSKGRVLVRAAHKTAPRQTRHTILFF